MADDSTKKLDITDVYITDYIPTIYTTPCQLHFTQNNHARIASIFQERNSVQIIIYNRTRNVFVLVRQFRPSIYLNEARRNARLTDGARRIDPALLSASCAVALEFCAGLEDKRAPSVEIAREEVLEECGYDVKLEQLELVGQFPNSCWHTTGATCRMYYVEVEDGMRVGGGGGVEDECIEVVEMGVEEVMEYVQGEVVNSPVHFLHGFYWFLNNKWRR